MRTALRLALVLPLVLAACDDTTAPAPPRTFAIVSVNGEVDLDVACPAPEGGTGGRGLSRASILTLYGTGRFEWSYGIGAWEQVGSVGSSSGVGSLEQGAYRVRGDTLLLTHGTLPARTHGRGRIASDAIELLMDQDCRYEPALEPLRVRLEETTAAPAHI